MNEVRRYRKLPVEIEAIQLLWGSDFVRAVGWIRANGGVVDFNNMAASGGVDHLSIHTLEGPMKVPLGWFVIRGVKGEFYGCEPEIFKLSYETA